MRPDLRRLPTPHLTRLRRTCLLLLLASAAGRAQGAVLLHDNVPFSSGPYLAYATPFNKGWYIQDTDFTDSIAVEPDSFPDRTVLTSSWPEKPCPVGIYNFNAIDFGNYSGTHVKQPIRPRQVSDIKALSETHSFSMSGATSGFNVIDQSFLTERPNDQRKRLFEIDVFLHTPPFSADYAAQIDLVGTFRDGGVTWTVHTDRRAATALVLFQPDGKADVASGTVDLKAMFDWLVEKKILTGHEWFNGMAIGMQTHRGSGTLDIERFSALYR